MGASLTQTVEHLLGLSFPQLEDRHASLTLAEIAAGRGGPAETLSAAMNATIDAYAFAKAVEGQATQQAIAQAHNGVSALLQAPAGSPLAPLLGSDQDVAALPHGGS